MLPTLRRTFGALCPIAPLPPKFALSKRRETTKTLTNKTHRIHSLPGRHSLIENFDLFTACLACIAPSSVERRGYKIFHIKELLGHRIETAEFPHLKRKFIYGY